MDEKRIKEIMKDPNTWEWDGCTLPEDAESHYPKEFNDKWAKFVEQHKRLNDLPFSESDTTKKKQFTLT